MADNTATVTEAAELPYTVETFDGIMESAYSKPLPEPIKFAGEYNAWKSYAVIPANLLPTEKDILDFVNNKAKANARQKAMQAALDLAKVERPTLENDPQLRLKKMYDIFMADGNFSHEEARALASSNLKIEWAK